MFTSPFRPRSYAFIATSSSEDTAQSIQNLHNFRPIETDETRGKLAWEDKKIRNKICETFCIPSSEWPRAYPENNVTYSIPPSIPEYKLKQLINEIKDHFEKKAAKLDDIETFSSNITDFNSPLNNISKSYIRFASYLQYMLKNLIPELQHITPYTTLLYKNNFNDFEINKIYSVIDTPIKVGDYSFQESIGGKSIMLQKTAESAAVTVVAMLVYDDYGDISEIDMKSSCEQNIDDLNIFFKQNFHKVKFNCLTKHFVSINQLKKNIKTFGPAIIQQQRDDNKFIIIIDKIEDAGITIRDPYHGWMIQIQHDALNLANNTYWHIGPRFVSRHDFLNCTQSAMTQSLV